MGVLSDTSCHLTISSLMALSILVIEQCSVYSTCPCHPASSICLVASGTGTFRDWRFCVSACPMSIQLSSVAVSWHRARGYGTAFCLPVSIPSTGSNHFCSYATLEHRTAFIYTTCTPQFRSHNEP
ncbi:hypothetical protein AVEN_181829-1 [Araneus ventricosus]|uniref:Secreted protein n=1 Tax=Araneus ventricosus TaxID=182803 RepID=A0A4Y2EWK7_ARAVE|nr:hypothetical protein AVEN_181829-1 [Araneus ventricosus]